MKWADFERYVEAKLISHLLKRMICMVLYRAKVEYVHACSCMGRISCKLYSCKEQGREIRIAVKLIIKL